MDYHIGNDCVLTMSGLCAGPGRFPGHAYRYSGAAPR